MAPLTDMGTMPGCALEATESNGTTTSGTFWLLAPKPRASSPKLKRQTCCHRGLSIRAAPRMVVPMLATSLRASDGRPMSGYLTGTCTALPRLISQSPLACDKGSWRIPLPMVGGLPLTMSSANVNTSTHGRPAQPRAYSSCLWSLKAVLVDGALLLRKLGSCWLRLCLLEVAKEPALNCSGCCNPLASRCSAKMLGQSFVALSS